MDDKLKGKFKEAKGKLTHDKPEELEGKAQAKKGDIENKVKGVMYDVEHRDEHRDDDRPENA